MVDFTQGGVTLKVRALNGEHPIRRVGSGRLKSAYIFADGKTEGQKTGGFAPAENALDVNWIICPRTVPIAVSRTDKVRIFDPETNQSARAWAIDYRKYHDLWITDNKWPQVWVNCKQGQPVRGCNMIILQRDNVVRRVASDEAARKLEEQGFARTGGAAETEHEVNLTIDVKELGRQIANQLRTGEPLTDETIAKALLDEEEQPAKPAAKPKGGGKAAPESGCGQ